MDDLLGDFVAETTDTLEMLDVELVRFEHDPAHAGTLDQMFRCVHTIKGTCGFLDLPRLESLAHAAESLIAGIRETSAEVDQVSLLLALFDRIKFVVGALAVNFREPPGDDRDLKEAVTVAVSKGVVRPGGAVPQSEPVRVAPGAVPADLADPPSASPVQTSVRIGVDRLDGMMATVSELVQVRNQLLDIARRDSRPGYTLALQRLSNITGQLQDSVMRTRMHPIGGAWASMPRIARDLSLELNKSIVVRTSGDETEIDRQILEVVRDSLIHLVRNAADHGIESRTERTAKGKPEAGTIQLSAHQDSSHIVVDIEDDGRGIDCERLRQRALAAGIIDADDASAMSDEEVCRLIFRPGLSTAGAITTLSGRGVGLDAVKDAVERAGGAVEIANNPGQGLRLRLRLPLTLAIASAMIVESDGVRFAIPQLQVTEVVRTTPGTDIRIEAVGGVPTLRLRDRVLPLIDLAATLAGQAPMVGDDALIMVCRAGAGTFGLVVTAVLHAEEVVIKPLSVLLRDIPYFSGATILGDGSVALILDPSGFLRLIAPVTGAVAADHRGRSVPVAVTQQPTVLCAALDGMALAIPAGLVSRLEEVPAERIERGGDGYRVRLDGHLVPLLGLEAAGPGTRPLNLVLFRHTERSVALAVGELIDIVDADVRLDPAPPGGGCFATALFDGRTVHVPDVAALLEAHAAPVRAGAEQPSALLLEPDVFLSAMLEMVLETWGYAVRTVGAASMLAAAGSADVWVLDLDAHAGTDFSAMRPAGCPVMIGTATRPTEDLRSKAIRAGLSAVVGKFDRRALFAALECRASGKEAA